MLYIGQVILSSICLRKLGSSYQQDQSQQTSVPKLSYSFIEHLHLPVSPSFFLYFSTRFQY